MLARQEAVYRLPLQQVEAVRHLHSLGRCPACASANAPPRSRLSTATCAPPCSSMLLQPLREGCGVSVGQQIDDPMLVEIHQDRAIAAATTQGSGKGMVLPPFPPLRTGLVPFDTSGSSLSFRRCYPTGFLNSQSGRMELVMTRGMQQEAICHII